MVPVRYRPNAASGGWSYGRGLCTAVKKGHTRFDIILLNIHKTTSRWHLPVPNRNHNGWFYPPRHIKGTPTHCGRTGTCPHNNQSKGEGRLFIVNTIFSMNFSFLKNNIIVTCIVSWPITTFPSGQFL